MESHGDANEDADVVVVPTRRLRSSRSLAGVGEDAAEWRVAASPVRAGSTGAAQVPVAKPSSSPSPQGSPLPSNGGSACGYISTASMPARQRRDGKMGNKAEAEGKRLPLMPSAAVDLSAAGGGDDHLGLEQDDEGFVNHGDAFSGSVDNGVGADYRDDGDTDIEDQAPARSEPKRPRRSWSSGRGAQLQQPQEEEQLQAESPLLGWQQAGGVQPVGWHQVTANGRSPRAAAAAATAAPEFSRRKRSRRQEVVDADAEADATMYDSQARWRSDAAQNGEEWRVISTPGGSVGDIDEGGGSEAPARRQKGVTEPQLLEVVDTESSPAAEEAENAQGTGKGKGSGKGNGKGEGGGNEKRKEKKKGKKSRRKTAAAENLSDSYSDISYQGPGDCSPSRCPARRRPRSTRNQARTAFSVHPPPPPTTRDEPLVIDSDDDVQAVRAAQACADPSRPTAAAVTSLADDDDDDGVSNGGGVRRDSSFVETFLGDGVVEPRTRLERRGALPGFQKVRLSWATAFLREEELHEIPHETRLVYPNKETTGAVRVTRSDLVRLEENVFLNDTIIDFYLRYLLARPDSFAEGLEPRSVHAFSPLVVQGITNVSDAPGPDAYWRKVQKWTKGLNLFDKKIVLFPINSALHWSLLVLINPDRFEDRVKEIALKKASAAATPDADAGADSSQSAVGEEDGGGGGDGRIESGDGKSESGASGFGSPVRHTEGAGQVQQQQEDRDHEDEEMSLAGARPVKTASRAACADVAANWRVAAPTPSSTPLSPPGSSGHRHDQAASRYQPGGMLWPPSSEIRRHNTAFLDEGKGLSGGGCGIGGGAGALPGSAAEVRSRPSRHFPSASQAEFGGNGGSGGGDPVGCASGSGDVARKLRGGSEDTEEEFEDEAGYPMVIEKDDLEAGGGRGGAGGAGEALDMEVEEDSLSSRAGEIVGGGRTRALPSRPPPAAAATRAVAAAATAAASGSGSGSSSIEAVDVHPFSGGMHGVPWLGARVGAASGSPWVPSTGRRGRAASAAAGNGKGPDRSPFFPGVADGITIAARAMAVRRRKKAQQSPSPSQSHSQPQFQSPSQAQSQPQSEPQSRLQWRSPSQQSREAEGEVPAVHVLAEADVDGDEAHEDESAEEEDEEEAGTCSLLELFDSKGTRGRGPGKASSHGGKGRGGYQGRVTPPASRKGPAVRRGGRGAAALAEVEVAVSAPSAAGQTDEHRARVSAPGGGGGGGGRGDDGVGGEVPSRSDVDGAGVADYDYFGNGDEEGHVGRGGGEAPPSSDWRVKPTGTFHHAGKKRNRRGTLAAALAAAAAAAAAAAGEDRDLVASVRAHTNGDGAARTCRLVTSRAATLPESESDSGFCSQEVTSTRSAPEMHTSGGRDTTERRVGESAGEDDDEDDDDAVPEGLGQEAGGSSRLQQGARRERERIGQGGADAVVAAADAAASTAAAAAAAVEASTAPAVAVDSAGPGARGGCGGVADPATGDEESPLHASGSSAGDFAEGGNGEGGGGKVDDKPIPCMLLLDSTRGHRSQEMFKMVRKYVEAAWNNTQGGGENKVDVTAKVLGGCSPPIPQQTNDCDCGVYVIYYAKLILQNPPVMTQSFLDKKGKGGMFSSKWFDKSVISDTRKTIRGTVESLRWECLQQERAAAAVAATVNARRVQDPPAVN